MNGAQKCFRGISDTVDSDSLSHIVKNNHPKSKSLSFCLAATGIGRPENTHNPREEWRRAHTATATHARASLVINKNSEQTFSKEPKRKGVPALGICLRLKIDARYQNSLRFS